METVVEKYIWRLSAEDGSCFLFNSEDVQDLIIRYHFVLDNVDT